MAYFQINLSNFFLKTVRFRTVNSALAVHDIFKPGRYEDFWNVTRTFKGCSLRLISCPGIKSNQLLIKWSATLE